MVCVDELEGMRRRIAVDGAMRQAPGPVTLLVARPLVKVRVTYGRALAVTDTHVLHEWVRHGEYHCRWDHKRLVQRVGADEWMGEALD